MGQTISATRAELQQGRAAAQPGQALPWKQNIEQLDFLYRMAHSKLDVMEGTLTAGFRDPKYQNKVQIVGDRAMRTERRYTVNMKEGADEVRNRVPRSYKRFH